MTDENGSTTQTPHGPAQCLLAYPDRKPRAVVALGHGAGGSVLAPDLTAVAEVASSHGLAVARITQPYRVAGRRAPAPARQLDAAWIAVLAQLPAGLSTLPLIVGGRSSGARVACRTARAVGAVGVLALAFPLQPPRKAATAPNRAAELATGLPTLVINGDRDPFGAPEPSHDIQVEILPGDDHSLRRHPALVAERALGWLTEHGWA